MQKVHANYLKLRGNGMTQSAQGPSVRGGQCEIPPGY